MDPASIIGIGASLLGGLFGGSKQKWVTPNYADIRAKAEAAGFNPLTALAMNAGQVGQSQNYMGQAIADAGMLMADAMAKKTDKNQLDQAQAENQRLKEKVQSLTLRPIVGGVYAQREAVPSVPQALGVPRGSAVARSSENQPLDVAGGPSTRVAVLNQVVEPNPAFSDADQIEARYGDVASWVYGIGTIGADVYHNRQSLGRALKEGLRRDYKPGQTFGKPLSMRDGIEMPPGYDPHYPVSKKKKLLGWWDAVQWPTGAPMLGGY